MSKIEEIYGLIITKLQSVLTGYLRIANPYAIENNPAMILAKGYGLAIGPGVNTQRYVGCIQTWQRSFTIVVSRQLVNTENDATGKAIIEVAMLNAHEDLLTAFESDPTLGGVDIKAVITDDSGIQYLEGQDGKFLAIEMVLSVEYQKQS